MSRTPALSIVIASHNRRDELLDTLERIDALELPAADRETIVVDNASTDGTAEALRARPDVRCLPLRTNLGACAKQLGIRAARAPLLLFLDDDSSPLPGTLPRLISRLADDESLVAAGCTVHLPDGREECSALPCVFAGCGVGLRTAAVRAVGGLDTSFFMAAEEYDLAFRLLATQGRVELFSDLKVEHRKSPAARHPGRTLGYDARNNLRIVARYLPAAAASTYRDDWLLRYRWLAQAHGHLNEYRRGVAISRWQLLRERWAYRRYRLPAAVFERVFAWDYIERRMMRLAERGVRRVAFADLGKNIYAFVRGARSAGLSVRCIADDRFAAPGRTYRDIPVLPIADAAAQCFDAWVVSNTSYVHARQRARELAPQSAHPVHAWFTEPGNSHKQSTSFQPSVKSPPPAQLTPP